MWVVSIICVDKTRRNQRIASKLVTAATTSARKHNCDSSAVIVSNKYPQRIFEKASFVKRTSIEIDSVRDNKGERVFKKSGEHENITLMTKTFIPDKSNNTNL